MAFDEKAKISPTRSQQKTKEIINNTRESKKWVLPDISYCSKLQQIQEHPHENEFMKIDPIDPFNNFKQQSIPES